MIQKGKTEVLEENVSNVYLCTKNLIWTDKESNPCFRDKTPMTNRLSPACIWKYEFHVTNYTRPSPYRAVNTLRLGYENHPVNAVQ